jgi:predicted Zn-dependent peptidase
MSKTLTIVTVVAAAVLTGTAWSQSALTEPIPSHPRDLKFSPLKFDVPDPAKYAHKLANGIPVYVAEDSTLPLVSISVLLRAGEFVEPKDQPGVAPLTASLMREGGAGDLTAEQFDERADFLAADISSWAHDTQAGADLDCLTSQLDPALDLFFAMLRSPRFQQSRIDTEKAQTLEGMKQRNDDARSIQGREWSWLMNGMEHYSTRELTRKQLEAVSREGMIAFHKAWWRPENMIVAVSGDVKSDSILAKLNERFASWKATGPKLPWPPAPPAYEPKPGLYHVEKDIPQGRVFIGHRGAKWDPKFENPDFYALMVMNDILGGGGFTSRITKRIRSDEGLAYSAGSAYGIGTYWPGTFRVSFQTKSPTVAYAAKIALEEIRRIQRDPVGDDELTTSKNSFIDTFPREFESAADIVGAFAGDDYIGRPHAYWVRFRDNIRAVTAEDVRRVARNYLRPDAVTFLVVGRWAEIEKGDAGGKAKMSEFFEGKVAHLPLRDPLTLEPMK